MYNIDFEKPCHVHMLGIGGISMSGLAQVLLDRNFVLSGSDNKPSELTERLEKKGAKIVFSQIPENLTDDIDVVVYTAAVKPGNAEYDACIERGIPMMTRAELLGQIMKNYEHSIAVSGTHGKTTVTSMVTHILLAAGENPTVSVGGMLPIIGGNIHIGDRDMFVTEACEYTNSFLNFYPTIGVILNIEADHLDFFKNIDDIRNSFKLFVRTLPQDESGTVVICDYIDNYPEITEGFKGRIITFGSKDADVSADNIKFDENAFASFDLFIKGKFIDNIRLGIPGEHNVRNALAAIAVAIRLGIDEKVFKQGLEGFRGAKRRFEKKGLLGNKITIFDDYAHHPQEIEATLKAARNYPHERIVCVFQPHTYTRTKTLLKDFVKALALADLVVLPDIYPARETDTLGMSSGLLAGLINEAEEKAGRGTKAYYVPTFGEVETYLLGELQPGDVCITMGAGDVYLVGERLLGN
ncbi:MAG: UDP-N-acetylmuramate--L-alanine ligase [Lachnospiraceae bacterium]|nr:UDP-N-acetylmuramate--L-alanine ligase [Candidatus Darwinimomas equi]